MTFAYSTECDTQQKEISVAENSGISWTDHTFNPWIGCTQIGPGCDHCYAKRLAESRLNVQWGDDAPRYRTKDGNWSKVRRWQRGAVEFRRSHHRKQRVFSASLADIFDNQVPPEWRLDFWQLVEQCPDLEFLIVTKRVPNILKMLPHFWGALRPDGVTPKFSHVVMLATVVNQSEADRDVSRLIAVKRRFPWLRIGLSIEPMLGPVKLTREQLRWIDWVIVGGESAQGKGPRDLVALDPDWARDVADQCYAALVPFHFKQWGHYCPEDQRSVTDRETLDGVAHDGFPWQFPRVPPEFAYPLLPHVAT